MKKNRKGSLEIGKQLYQEARPYINHALKKEMNIFLIGKDFRDQNSMRYKILKAIENSNHNNISVAYPEYLFDEQILMKNLDLLSLENLLADSVDAVILCVESAGSFTELGAFSNHEQLNNKLIVYLDKKYQRDQSFINLGPVKYLRRKTLSKIEYISFEDSFNLKGLTLQINEIKKVSKKMESHDLLNLFFCMKFLLALFYVLNDVKRKEIIEIIKDMNIASSEEEKENMISTIDASLQTLLKEKKVKNQGGIYFLSDKGRKQLYKEYPPEFVYTKLDILSYKMLHLKLGKSKELVI